MTNSCVAGTFTTATDTATTTSTDTATTTSTDTTTTASTRAVELERALELKDFPNAIITTSTGQTADIMSILPSKVVPLKKDAPFNPMAMFDADGFIKEDQNMQSGKIEWKEMAVQGLHSCGRSNIEKRPRFIALAQETVAKNLTSTITSTVTATSTVTFSVTLQQCTTAGFTFALPSC